MSPVDVGVDEQELTPRCPPSGVKYSTPGALKATAYNLPPLPRLVHAVALPPPSNRPTNSVAHVNPLPPTYGTAPQHAATATLASPILPSPSPSP